MIVTLSGTLVSATPLTAVVETSGVGYELHIPVTTAERLPSPGTSVKLHTHVVYREDSQTLFGFATVAERDFFRLLIDHVTGVGPKVAITIMSKLSLPVLENAIRIGDIATLAKCPGIGKKTAERMVVELKGKLGGTGLAGALTSAADGDEASPQQTDTRIADAVAALAALGYKAADADQAIRRAALALGASATTEQLIKRALS
ncbi:holliday junction ATP-dependent DNA helicase RuvA [mine drainage metagenome]|uniref:Holliday junction ATP-dependent DNA helicase RuvA n=1 Tax=mine drainage metagenome TaxID=410659 RepID=A0A1J5R8F8_9ZZZZ